MSSRPSLLVVVGLVLALFLAGCMQSGSLESDPTTTDDGRDGENGRDATNGTSPPPADPVVQTPPGGDPGTVPSGNGTTNETTGANGTANLTAFEWGPESQATVRPGVQVTVGGSICTSNFLYRSPLNGTYYLGIAAHCVYDTVGEEVFLSDAIGVLGSQGARIGRVAYSSYAELGIQDDGTPVHPNDNDLALVRLDEGVLPKTHPSMKFFGGPVGNVTSLSDLALGEKLLAHGDTPMRPGPDDLDRLEGYVTGTTSPWTVHAYFAPYSFQGDSGSAVITADGRAVGVIVFSSSVPPLETGISFLPPMLGFAADKGFPVEVVTWSQFDSGLLPG